MKSFQYEEFADSHGVVLTANTLTMVALLSLSNKKQKECSWERIYSNFRTLKNNFPKKKISEILPIILKERNLSGENMITGKKKMYLENKIIISMSDKKCCLHFYLCPVSLHFVCFKNI